MKTATADKRYVIRAKTPQYREAMRRLFDSGVGRAQLHRILAITKGDIVGLKVARHIDTNNVWFAYRGRRYDLNADGTVASDTKIGKAGPAPKPVPKQEKTVKCQLCGHDTHVVRYDIKARCPVCGFRLVKCVVVRRSG